MYTLIPDLAAHIDPAGTESITSRTFYRGDGTRAVLFAFAAGQELSEHTSASSAILHILEGRAAVTLGDDAHTLQAGAWVAMPPRLKHSVLAETPLKMLLTMTDGAGA
jgi:quercetin dioxygenase-like cupin family protein